MNRRHARWIATIAALISCRAPASPSGLALIPTADLVPDKEFVAELQLDGSAEHFDTDTRFINFELGLADRIEAGVDYDASTETEEPWLFNAKLLAAKNEAGTALLAVGLRNLGAEGEPEGYAVATCGCGDLRGHFGCTCSEERNLDGIVGFDYEWCDGWWLYGEWTSGPENAGAAGVNVPLPGLFDLMTGIVIPNTSADDVTYTLHLVCGAPWPSLFAKE